MNDKVERVIERTDRNHNTDRLFLGECHTRGVHGGLVHGYHGAMVCTDMLGTELYTFNGTHYLDTGIDKRFSALGGCAIDQVVQALLHASRRLFKNFDTLCDRKPCVAVPEQGISRR